MPPAYGHPIDEQAWSEALALRADAEQLEDPRSFTRFLCGIRSPALSRAKLVKHDLFGSQAEVPFAKVLERARG